MRSQAQLLVDIVSFFMAVARVMIPCGMLFMAVRARDDPAVIHRDFVLGCGGSLLLFLCSSVVVVVVIAIQI